jgi:aspartate aminotransferase
MTTTTTPIGRGLSPAERMAHLGTESAFEVLAAARALEAKGRHIVHLEIGEPDFPTPPHIVEAAIQALKDGFTHYGPSAGLPEAREAVARHAGELRGLDFTPDQVVITPGAKPIMFFTIFALVDPGDEVIYPDPGFPIYESLVDFVGAKRVPIALREENDFRLDVNELRGLVTDRTRLIIINSPQNPTGSVLTESDLKAIAELCAERRIPVLADEIYSRILYDGSFRSIRSYPGMEDLTIILDGMSKTYAMTGWRLGYGIMPEELAVRVARLQTNSNSCTASFSQRAMLAAFQHDQKDVDDMVRTFQRRRDLIVELLNDIQGMSCRLPAGAFYVFPNVKSFGRPAKELAAKLLEEAGVATCVFPTPRPRTTCAKAPGASARGWPVCRASPVAPMPHGPRLGVEFRLLFGPGAYNLVRARGSGGDNRQP